MSGPIFELPMARKLREATESGRICSECGAEFVKPHGSLTACSYCWSRLPLAEQQSVQKATHEEVNRVAHANEARKRRENKNA